MSYARTARPLALALCLLASACFSSEKPLFQGPGEAVLGAGRLEVATYGKDDSTPETGHLEWTDQGYRDADAKDAQTLIFTRLDGVPPDSGLFIGQSGTMPPAASDKSESKGGYLYDLYRQEHDPAGDRIVAYSLSCRDLTAAQARRFHLKRNNKGDECVARRAKDLAAAFVFLSSRPPEGGHWIAKPAPDAASIPTPLPAPIPNEPPKT